MLLANYRNALAVKKSVVEGEMFDLEGLEPYYRDRFLHYGLFSYLYVTDYYARDHSVVAITRTVKFFAMMVFSLSLTALAVGVAVIVWTGGDFWQVCTLAIAAGVFLPLIASFEARQSVPEMHELSIERYRAQRYR